MQQVKVSQLTERQNYRQAYDAQFVASIAADMLGHGFLPEYPITVYADADTFVIIDGHTRYQSVLSLKNPDFLVWIVVKDKPTDADFKLMQLAANHNRRDTDPVSDGIGFQQALDAGATIEQLSSAIHHSADYIQRRLDLLKLNVDIRALVATGNLPLTYGIELSRLDTNFQNTAIQAFQSLKEPSKEKLVATVNDLYTKQSQATLFDVLPMFGGALLEYAETVTATVESKKPTYTMLERELQAHRALVAAERAARQADREYAKRAYADLKKQLETLKAQLKGLA